MDLNSVLDLEAQKLRLRLKTSPKKALHIIDQKYSFFLLLLKFQLDKHYELETKYDALAQKNQSMAEMLKQKSLTER